MKQSSVHALKPGSRNQKVANQEGKKQNLIGSCLNQTPTKVLLQAEPIHFEQIKKSVKYN